jgi:hypothetical protein
VKFVDFERLSFVFNNTLIVLVEKKKKNISTPESSKKQLLDNEGIRLIWLKLILWIEIQVNQNFDIYWINFRSKSIKII